VASPEQVRAAVDGYVDGYRKKDRDHFLSLFAPDAMWFDPVGAPPHVGHEGIGAFFGGTMELSESIEFERRELVVGGNEAAVLFTITVRLPGGGGMQFEAIETFEVDDDGRIRLLKAFWDQERARPL
jgi:steroid Delta-isomerase